MSLTDFNKQSNPAPAPASYLAPTWERSDKDGVGTAMSFASPLWYTIAGGVITEVFNPDVDTPQIKDIQFLVTDGSTIFHDPKVDYNRRCELIDPQVSALGYKMTHTSLDGRYTLVHEVISEPDASCLLVRTTLSGDPVLLPNLRIYVLVAPHIEGAGAGNSGYVASTKLGPVLMAHRANSWLAVSADVGLGYTGCGFSGFTDGWQDIIGHRRFPVWNYDCAINGNIALTGEINRQGQNQFVLAVAINEGDDDTPNGAVVSLSEALSFPFSAPAPGTYGHLDAFLAGWQSKAVGAFVPAAAATGDGGALFNFSRHVLLAHEDKRYDGALVASLSIPWGETQGDSNAGYHLVWPRDMSQSASALLAAGEKDLPLRGLLFLAGSQSKDGSWPRNLYITGKGSGTGVQLDEYSFPIILAYRLKFAGALMDYDPRPMVVAAAGALIANGPWTQQERWEEASGYSPSTLASNIAALICAADFVDENPADHATAEFLREYADFLVAHIEQWTVTSAGTLLPGVPRHFIRILPPPGDITKADLDPNSDSTLVSLANIPSGKRNEFPARALVDAGFLELVRYGIHAAGDPLFDDSLRVVDANIRHDFPAGPCFYRYSNDGYGQYEDGSNYNGAGQGRPWPLLAGERAHYELAAGRNVSNYVSALESFAGSSKLFPEQIWDRPDLGRLVYGGPAGSASPLAWAHAEYIKLVRSLSDGAVFDRIQIVANRYLPAPPASQLEVWNNNRKIPSIPRGKTLRIQLNQPFRLHWSPDAWRTVYDTPATNTVVGISYADIPTTAATPGPLVFTYFQTNTNSWIGGPDFQVSLT